MTVSVTSRGAAAALLAAALGLAALPGCGNSAPDKGESKKDEPKGGGAKADGPKPDDKKANSLVGAPPGEPKAALGEVDKGAEVVVMGFLRDLGDGAAKADVLSPALLKAVGRPWELPDDTAKGYSADAAARWLRTAQGKSFSPSLDRKQAGDAIYWRGAMQPAGSYSLRLLRDGGAWKIDWLALSTVDGGGPVTAGGADDALAEFAVRAFVEALADAGAMERNARAAILARGMVPPLRAAWAPPFDADKAQGYDYNPGKLALAATGYAGGTSAIAVAKAGDATYTVELTKPTGKKVLTVKLVKGATPGEWLVSEVAEKG